MVLAKPGAAAPSSVKPRHVLCFLGAEPDRRRLAKAANDAIGQFAAGFHVDTQYSQDVPDDRMVASFGVCWDRVAPDAWTHADEDAVLHHQSVLYVLSPPMTADTAVTISTAALFLVEAVITAGAVAVKGESAGVAHGLARWRELGAQCSRAVEAGDDLATGRACRLAFAKRPLESDKYVESVGFHLVGLPEVYVAKGLGTDREKAALMDAVADELAERKLDAVLRERKARISYASSYADDDFKFNPFGIVYIDQL
ncbi:MAG TPA: hypothetical protein VKY22_28475 [Bradyrhizobium sp.]|nr:hypothetical protein [Bradyrhizobium sp.]